MSNLTQDMSWSVRLALQSQFGLTNKQAAASFNVSVDEVATAQDLAKAGTITIATDVDYSQYEGEFEVSAKDTSSSSTSTSKPEVKAPTPVTATKPVPTPKKRGRKGDNIKNAFNAIPTVPTDANAYISKHGISMNVLRQSKRFDKSGTPGIVHVRKDKESGQLMVWRSDPTDA